MHRKLSVLLTVVTGLWSLLSVLLRWHHAHDRVPKQIKIKVKMK
ncbi:hypothetical protein [Lactiplantibacillus garii]|nr:hypothetical protein [Lactiplantibacillus garii]